jgi:hypothetical protein
MESVALGMLSTLKRRKSEAVSVPMYSPVSADIPVRIPLAGYGAESAWFKESCSKKTFYYSY